MPATTRCTRAAVVGIHTRRCCTKASANSVTVARPEVPVRMLNGGISSSAIFIAPQLSPHARLTPTSMRRAVVSAACCGEGGTVAAFRRGLGEGAGAGLCSTARAAAQAVAAGRNAGPVGHFVVLHRSLRCVTQPRDFRGLYWGAPASSTRHEVPLNFNGLAPHRRGSAEPAELPKERGAVA